MRRLRRSGGALEIRSYALSWSFFNDLVKLRVVG